MFDATVASVRGSMFVIRCSMLGKEEYDIPKIQNRTSKTKHRTSKTEHQISKTEQRNHDNTRHTRFARWHNPRPIHS
jgi:hypothetical protein